MPYHGHGLDLHRGQQQRGGDHRDDADGRRGGQQSAGARPVEVAEPDGAGRGGLAPQQSGDQEPGDDEEDVDADEAAVQAGDPGVEQHHGEHRHGAQALDVGAEPALGRCVTVVRNALRGLGFLVRSGCFHPQDLPPAPSVDVSVMPHEVISAALFPQHDTHALTRR